MTDTQGRALHFLHLGKTGGTAIKSALEPIRNHGPYRIELHRHPTRMVDVPAGEYFFFSVRDPVSRFVSGFYSRQRQGRPRFFEPWTEEETWAFTRFSAPNELAEQIFEDEDAQRAMRGIGHVRRSYWYWFVDEPTLRARSNNVFAILRQTHLAQDFAMLLDRVGLRDRTQLPTDPLLAHQNPAQADYRLSDRAIANLQKWYADDYMFLEVCTSFRFLSQEVPLVQSVRS